MNFFDFAGKSSMAEEDGALEATYTSECPILDCGFIGSSVGDMFYCHTSVNTLELCNLETANLISKVEKFPHDVQHLFSVQNSPDGLLLHTSNNHGLLVCYRVDVNRKQLLN